MDKWIDAFEVKPEYEKVVLVYTSDRDFYLAYWSVTDQWFDINEEYYMKATVYGEITHWLEIPEPPIILENVKDKIEEKPKIKNKGMFLDVWENCSAEDVFNEFCVLPEEKEGVNILFAYYDCPPYEGYAFVLFEKDGQLYEVNGSHCSCMGLENQWDPEKTTIEAMLFRCEKGSFYGYEKDLKELLLQLKEEGIC